MNLALITSKFPFDGKESFLYAEMTELKKHVQSITIIPATAKNSEHSYANLPGSVINLSVTSLKTFGAATAELFRAPFAVLSVLGEVISKPRSWGTKLNNFIIYPKALAVVRLVRRRRVSHVHAYWLSTPSTIAYVCSRLTRAEWSASGHRWDLVDTNLTSVPVAHAGFMNTAKFIRTISNRGCQQVLFALGTRSHTLVRKIHLGVQVPISEPVHSSDIRSFTLACVAGLERVKGHAYLLQALARALTEGLDVRCDFIGDGSLRRSLEEQALSLGVNEKVNFLGWLPVEEIHVRLRSGSYDAAILTSIDEGADMCEGIPVSLMEAMANQIPCIATDSGSVKELIDNEVGLLVRQRNPEGIAGAMLSLACDAKRRRRLGLNAAARIRENFSVDSTAAALYTLIEGATPVRSEEVVKDHQ